MLRVALGFIRTLLGVLAMAIITLTAAAFLIILVKIRPGSPLANRVLRFWGKASLFFSWTRVRVQGYEKIDPAGSYVFIGNHISNLDVPVMVSSLPVSVRFLAKAEMFKVPVLGGGMRAIHMVETDRHAGPTAHRRINEQVNAAIGAGLSLVIYPEGTRSRDARLKPFKKGAFRIAVEHNMPVVPVTISGTERAWKPGSRIVYGGTIDLIIHDPIPTEDLTVADLNELRTRVREIVAETYEELKVGHES